MFLAAVHLLQIKDLKDLRPLLCRRGTIDMQVLKDLKRCFHGRGPVPRQASIAMGNGLAGVCFSRRSAIAGDRPPPYGPGKVFLLRRSGSGEPELQSLLGPLGPKYL